MLTNVFLALSLLAFLSFLSSVFFVFHQPSGSRSNWLLGLKLASIVTWVVDLTDVALFSKGPDFVAYLAVGTQCVATALYWVSTRAARTNRLSIAFIPMAPKALISNGPFRFLLHPFYTSYVLSYWSVFAFTLHWSSFAAAATMHALYFLTARQEELLLANRFGLEYSLARRRRWSPFALTFP